MRIHASKSVRFEEEKNSVRFDNSFKKVLKKFLFEAPLQPYAVEGLISSLSPPRHGASMASEKRRPALASRSTSLAPHARRWPALASRSTSARRRPSVRRRLHARRRPALASRSTSARRCPSVVVSSISRLPPCRSRRGSQPAAHSVPRPSAPQRRAVPPLPVPPAPTRPRAKRTTPARRPTPQPTGDEAG